MIDHGFGVVLGPLDSNHAEHVRKWRNDPRVWNWCRQYKPISDFDQDSWFERQANDPTIQMYSILLDGSLAGVCGFTSIDLINRRAEFSLYVAPDLNGRGIGTKSLLTLLRHGFNQWGFNSIWGESFEGNPAIRIFKKIGMKQEGIRRGFYFRDGKFIDAHLYGILASEWGGASHV